MTHPVRHRGGFPPALHELEDLRSRVDQLMHAAFPSHLFPESEGVGPWAPLADVEDSDDAYLMELELPGVDKDQVTVEVAEGEIDVHGEIKEKERAGVVRSHTRRVGQFDYRATLPPNVDTQKVSAEMANGVLTVRVPKTEQGKTRRIEISG